MDISLWKRLVVSYVFVYKKRISIAVIFMILSALATALSANLIDPVINKVFINKDIGQLYSICALIVAAFLIKSLSVYAYKVLMNGVEVGISTKLSQDLFEKLIFLKIDDLASIKTGKIITYFSSDIRNIKTIMSAVIVNVAKEALTVVFLVGLMFFKSPTLSCIALFGFPIAFYPLVKLTKQLRKIYKLSQDKAVRVNIFLQNIFDGVKTVKSFCQEEYESKNMQKILDEILNLEIKSGKVGFIGSPLMEFVGGLAASLVILYGGYNVINGDMTPGSFFAFLTALLMLYKPIKSTSNLGMVLQSGYISLQRIFEVLDMKVDTRSDKGRWDLDFSNVCLEFKNLSFRYGGGENESHVLHGLDIDIKKYQKVALVGESGGGKSTIVKLILKFHKVEDGQIFINGVDINEINTTFLRKNISYVGQDVMLFDGTILSNLTYGIQDYTSADLERVLKLANAFDFVENLPRKLNTKVGHMGGNLSSGQRQRIIIARAMLKDAPIVILDEATSALDNKTEREIQSALDALIVNKTTIIIAHRLQTITSCDKIYLLESGVVAESGTHDELLQNKDSKYFGMWHRY